LILLVAFISKSHPECGSLMVRALVSSMYKHAGHHDLYTIFKQVNVLHFVTLINIEN